MLDFLAIAAGVLAVVAALAGVKRRSHRTINADTALQPVSDEWLSNARGRKEEGW